MPEVLSDPPQTGRAHLIRGDMLVVQSPIIDARLLLRDPQLVPSEPLTDRERFVGECASQGWTLLDVANDSSLSLKEARQARCSLMHKYGSAKKMAPVINKLILGNEIELDAPDDPLIRLRTTSLRILAHVMTGHSTGIMSKELDIGKKEVQDTKTALFTNLLKVSGENHAVRVAHEKGLVIS